MWADLVHYRRNFISSHDLRFEEKIKLNYLRPRFHLKAAGDYFESCGFWFPMKPWGKNLIIF